MTDATGTTGKLEWKKPTLTTLGDAASFTLAAAAGLPDAGGSS